jgi:uncharacterized membrane protein
MTYLIIKWLHILSSTLLFGTGLGSAFYMLFTSLTRNPVATAIVVRKVVLADWLFTTPTIIIQPLTGLAMMHIAGIPLTSKWIVWSFVLYFVAGACWLPVVWIQIQMRDLADAAVAANQPLPARYWKLLRVWVLLGIPAFVALVIVFWLMVNKPA